MSKYRLHLINDYDKDFVKHFQLRTDVRDGAYFCLVNKKGVPYYEIDENKNKQIPIYCTNIYLERDNIFACKLAQKIEGYTVMAAYCQLHNIDFKEYSPLTLCSSDLTQEAIDIDNFKHINLSFFNENNQYLIHDSELLHIKNVAHSLTQGLRLIEATENVIVDNIISSNIEKEDNQNELYETVDTEYELD